jgi:hypothetical protein
VLPESSAELFRFCQLDFSVPIGPADGRYLARGDETDPASEVGELFVIVFQTLDAGRRSSLRGRRPKRAEPGDTDPQPVPISRVTVIDSDGFENEEAAGDWLDRCRRNESERERSAARALGIVNRAIHAHRVSAGDPYERELIRRHAVSARLGYGAGDDVVEGRWRAAYLLPAPRVRVGRRQMLSPQEQVAGILSGRNAVHPSEDLALRARLDLDHGRTRQAALQLRAATDACEAELAASADQSSSKALEALSRTKGTVDELAAVALAGELDDEQTASLSERLAEIERVLRRRRHAEAPQ